MWLQTASDATEWQIKSNLKKFLTILKLELYTVIQKATQNYWQVKDNNNFV